MSSPWKNLIPRRKYRERRQLQSRKHLGILEKKQDYKKRAVEHHKKERQMENLREKVLNKNPDEFYYNMINAKMVEGEHKIKGKKGADDLNKNLRLLEMSRMTQKNRAEKLQSQLHLTDVAKVNTHTFFVQNKSQIKRKTKELQKAEEEKQGKKEELLAKIAFEKFGGNLTEFEDYYHQVQSEKKQAYHTAAQSMQRERMLNKMKGALELDQKLRGKGKKRKVVDKKTGKESYEWFTERKR